MLQQTRVEQGKDYYLKFIRHYPNVHALANATEGEVLADWQGLGYYSRARNMHAAAQYISKELKGVFPKNYKGILELKGVGPYTAAAIASFAYELPYAVVDGNVFRVLSRYFGISTPIDSTEGKKEINQLAQQLLKGNAPSAFNQAIMDFGAMQCSPQKPDCDQCPLQDTCSAYANEMVSELPIKIKKIKKKTRYFNYLIIKKENAFIMEQRTADDIWKSLYQFPLFESDKTIEELPIDIIKTHFNKLPIDTQLFKARLVLSSRQTLTHRYIEARFWQIESNISIKKDSAYALVSSKNKHKFAFPKIIADFFKENE